MDFTVGEVKEEKDERDRFEKENRHTSILVCGNG